MAREQFPVVAPRPSQNRRGERARRARDMKNRDIPDVLRASPRARHGIHKADLITDPPIYRETPRDAFSPSVVPDIKIRVQCADTLSAAAKMSDRPFAIKRVVPTSKSRQLYNPNVTVLNMASQLRPGGGFLDGANSQEEFICARTTLYPSLWDSFYRLPDVGGIHTPDVLVFRDHLPEANELAKRDRFFVDVISSGMFKFSDARSEGCTCGMSYCDRHRDLVARKMKAVLRIAQIKGAQRLVLGAWGCGAYGNPVTEIAKLWRKVIAGAQRQRRPNSERWDGIQEIIFAIPDRTMLREFEDAFADILAPEEPDTAAAALSDGDDESSGEISELLSRIAEIEMQMEQAQNGRLRARLREVLGVLQRELAQGLAMKASRDEDMTTSEDEHDLLADEAFISGLQVASSDCEDNGGFYHFDENDIASDSSASDSCTPSESYDFRSAPAVQGHQPHHRHRASISSVNSSLPSNLLPCPQFDPETGWFAGSMDQLSALLRGGMVPGVAAEDDEDVADATMAQRGQSPSNNGKASPNDPGRALVRSESRGLEIDEFTLKEYLARYQGSDVTED